MPTPSILIEKQRILWIAGVGILLVVSGFLYMPSLAAIRRLAQERGQLQAELADARRVIDSLRQGTVPALPSVDELSEILAELNALARSHQVQILEVTPQPPRPGGTASEPVILPLELRVEAEYRSLGEFLGMLNQTPVLGAVSVRRIGIEREEQWLPRLRARLSVELALGPSLHG